MPQANHAYSTSAKTPYSSLLPVAPNSSQATPRQMLNNAQPAPPPQVPPPGLLVPEATALTDCLLSATAKAGKIYLNVPLQYRRAPQSLALSFGEELNRYDELCDVIQANLKRAILVLKRDLEREKRKIEADGQGSEQADSTASESSCAPTPDDPDPVQTTEMLPESRKRGHDCIEDAMEVEGKRCRKGRDVERGERPASMRAA
ncbi:hypothetical protein NM688_g8916 [Phlebia brevispora]|uniref:Uncharacterized protein n=1 Tax=Phlebia brevispora TaxID=194682 RepID=A0ACC1RLK3_9APHY|nr:hypothetical protein NM688_g8916 [Phlebia brevispora]